MFINTKTLNYVKYFSTQIKHHLKIDYANYFLIDTNNYKQYIIVQYVNQTSSVETNLITVWCSKTSKGICKAIIKNQLITNKMSEHHCIYIGNELMKAEISLILNQRYIQS